MTRQQGLAHLDRLAITGAWVAPPPRRRHLLRDLVAAIGGVAGICGLGVLGWGLIL